MRPLVVARGLTYAVLLGTLYSNGILTYQFSKSQEDVVGHLLAGLVKWREALKIYYTCYYCGHFGNDVTQTDDHRYPQRLGGVITVDACRYCNSQKGGKTAQQYARWLLEHPDEMRSGVPYPDSNRRRFVRRTIG